MTEINWSKPIEAVHEDGRVVAMKLAPSVFQPEDGLYVTESGQVELGVDNRWWKPDGKHNWRDSRWHIRNVPQPTPQADTKPDLTARMEALVRAMADVPSDSVLGQSGYASEARAIRALLPEPVDPDLIEAREIASRKLKELGASAEQIAAGEIAAGERDDAIVMHVARAALARGRALALAGEKEA